MSRLLSASAFAVLFGVSLLQPATTEWGLVGLGEMFGLVANVVSAAADAMGA